MIRGNLGERGIAIDNAESILKADVRPERLRCGKPRDHTTRISKLAVICLCVSLQVLVPVTGAASDLSFQATKDTDDAIAATQAGSLHWRESSGRACSKNQSGVQQAERI